MEIHIKLGDILRERGLTQKWLVEQTGIRSAAISEMVNNQRTSINKEHIAKVCEVLEITDFNTFFEWK